MLGPDRFGNSSIEKVVATTNNSKLLDLTARKLNSKIETDTMDINEMNEKRYTDYMYLRLLKREALMRKKELENKKKRY